MGFGLSNWVCRFTSRSLLILFLWWGTSGCEEEDITSLLNIFITDSPIDADSVSALRIVISDVAWKRDGTWESIRYLEEPIDINMLPLSSGNSFPIINQYTPSANYSALRLTLKLAQRNSSLIISPRSDIQFTDGSTQSLYWHNNEPTEVVIEKEINIPSRQYVGLVVDFDLRKSIRLNAAGEYILEPIARLINTSEAGLIDVVLVGAPSNNVVGYVYRPGAFSDSELAPSTDAVAFKNAVTSAKTDDLGRMIIAFVEQGVYELVFVEHDRTGSALTVFKREPGVEVKAGEVTALRIQ